MNTSITPGRFDGKTAIVTGVVLASDGGWSAI